MPNDSSTDEFGCWDADAERWTEPDEQSLLSLEPSRPFSGRWPRSGSMRSGRVYRRPAWEPPTAASGSSSSPGLGFLPSPRTTDTNGPGMHGDGGLDLRTAVSMLPTSRATDGTKGGPNQRGSSGDLMLPSAVTLLPTPTAQEPGGTLADYHARLSAHDGRQASFAPLSMAVQLPTTTVMDSRSSGGNPNTTGTHGTTPTDATARHPDRWGQYADAIHRWEAITHPAPAPTEVGPKGSPRLSARFSEWMMGVPDGWITDVPGITRNEALKLAGNGVVPQQACAAVVHLADRMVASVRTVPHDRPRLR